MPLRDHFRSPLDDVHSWDELHGMWPAVIVQHLCAVLPEPYFAAPGVHLGSLYYARPKPMLTLEPQLPKQDVYEVRVYDSRRNRDLVAAIEILSPSNKDRPENRASFVAKVVTLLKHNNHPLAIGQPLPTQPIWLNETWAISLDLESSYEETCRTLRIR